MPLPNNLIANEVKNSAGVEVEFNYQSTEGRERKYALAAPTPNRDHLIRFAHQTVGEGVRRKRFSIQQVTKEVTGADGAVAKIVFTMKLEVPEGNLANYDEVKNVVAEGMSLLASAGATTTILFDCTGYGAQTLVHGTL